MFEKEIIDKYTVSIKNNDLGISCEFHINNDNTISIKFLKNSRFVAIIDFYSGLFKFTFDENTFDFESGFFRMFLEDNYSERCFDDIVNLLYNELNKYAIDIGGDFTIRLFIYNDKSTFIRCDYVDGNYEYRVFNICKHDFKLDNVLGIIPIRYITLESAIYDYAVECKSSMSAELVHVNQSNIFSYVEFNDFKYYAVPDILNRLCQHDNLRKLDFLNTGKVINLSDEEIKKYERYVVKCVTFGNESNAELFVKKDGTCMIIYP